MSNLNRNKQLIKAFGKNEIDLPDAPSYFSAYRLAYIHNGNLIKTWDDYSHRHTYQRRGIPCNWKKVRKKQCMTKKR